MQELVEAIKAGDRARLAELYERNTGLLFTLARRYRGLDPMVSDEDLMQAGFLGLAAAVDAWDPDRGAWSTIATLYIKNAMQDALGLRGTRQRAHLGAVSLDAPIGEDGNASLADTLADESLPDADARLLEDDRRAAVRAAVGRLEGRKREVVERHYLQGETYTAIGEQWGVALQRVHQTSVNALRNLRSDWRLRKALDEETRFYQHKGVEAFNRDWTSVTEKAALWRIERRERLENIRKASEEGGYEDHDKGAAS